MDLETIFTVQNSDLDKLTPEQGVNLLREMLWAEASTLGISENFINVPSAINDPDGGIDAEVNGIIGVKGKGLIKEGITRYQVKIGDFNLKSESKIRELLFEKNRRDIKARIKYCLDNNGTLVIFLTGWDKPETRDNQICDAIIKQLIKVNPRYNSINIDIWRQNNIIRFLKNYPSLSLKVNHRHRTYFFTHLEWSKFEDMQSPYIFGDQQRKIIEDIRKRLRVNDSPIHLRILGEPGIGKTRMVLEATNTHDLSPLVIYIPKPRDFENSGLIGEIKASNFNAILILDECDPHQRATIWNQIKAYSPRIKLITIYYEFEKIPDISCIEIPPLPHDAIRHIIEQYDVPQDRAYLWAIECSGSPRVAHVIGENLINNPTDIFASPSNVNVWDRYIVGNSDSSSQIVYERKIVLMYLALFKKFGYEEELSDEAEYISDLIKKDFPEIGWGKFVQIVNELKNRKILQGEITLHITPKLLHIKLWIDWWAQIHIDLGFDVLKDVSDHLMYWFFEMFKYAPKSKSASNWIKNLFSDKGIYQQDQKFVYTPVGLKSLLFLSDISPEDTMKFILRKFEDEYFLDSMSSRITRHSITKVLGNLAKWRHLFADVAKTLMYIGLLESEADLVANSTRSFHKLFVINWYKQNSYTGATPEEKFLILKDLFENSPLEHRKIVLQSFEQALQVKEFTSWGIEEISWGSQPDLWFPLTYKEIYDAYAEIWIYLETKFLEPSVSHKNEISAILIKSAKNLNRFKSLSLMIKNTIELLSYDPNTNFQDIVELVLHILKYDSSYMPPEILQEWLLLERKLSGNDYPSRLKRYVGLNIREDEYGSENRKQEFLDALKELAQISVDSPSLFRKELHWLNTSNASRAAYLGAAIGLIDTGTTLLQDITKSIEKMEGLHSLAFLGGYLRVIFEANPEKWELLINDFENDHIKVEWIPELTWRSGKIDRYTILRILRLVEQRVIPPHHLRIYGYARDVSSEYEELFQELIRKIIAFSEVEYGFLALEMIYHRYVVINKPVPKLIAMAAFANPILFLDGFKAQSQSMTSYYWEEIGKAIRLAYPELLDEILEVLLKSYGQSNAILSDIYSRPVALLMEITNAFPEKTWVKLIRLFEPPYLNNSYALVHWLKGSVGFGEVVVGAIGLIPSQLIWTWVEENIEERAQFIAYMLPPIIKLESAGSSLARELLIRYGHRDDVQLQLFSNFSADGWSGLASEHYRKKREIYLSILREETNRNVIVWLRTYTEYLYENMKEAEVREERFEF